MPKKQSESNMDDPAEFAAWAFAAGIPDPRGEAFGHQPLIPAPCFGAVSKMLWDFGFRHHAELQTAWVPDYAGPDRNLVALGVTATSPEELLEQATEMLVSEFPDVAQRISEMTPENKDALMAEQAARLRESLENLRKMTQSLGGSAP